MKQVEISASGLDGIISYSFNGGYNGGAYTATVKCVSHSVNIGSHIDIYAGYDGNTQRVFSGYVKQINYNIPNNSYDIMLYDELIKAVDYFIASSTPDSAYTVKNKSAESLVGDILNMANITSYDYEATNFIFGVHGEGEVNLVGAYDYIHGIADLLAYHIWADKDGTVHFRRRLPYITDSDVADFGISTSQIIKYSPYTITDRDLRNRIVIYGRGVYAEAKVSSPYLPSGFYKSVVLSSPHIDDQTYAQRAADYNLEKLNKLTEQLTIQIEGIPEIFPLQVINIADGIYSGKWLVYSLNTNISSRTGFIQDVVLRR